MGRLRYCSEAFIADGGVPDRLSKLLAASAADPLAFGRRESSPVLLWNDAPPTSPKPLIFGTVPNYRPGADESAHDPLVFSVVKGNAKTNAFALGITLGRAAGNDLPVDQPSVSRFHCYFQRDGASGIWYLVDAESFNGTFCEGVRLAPNRPAPLPDRARVAFGSVEMRFLSPQAFAALLSEKRR